MDFQPAGGRWAALISSRNILKGHEPQDKFLQIDKLGFLPEVEEVNPSAIGYVH